MLAPGGCRWSSRSLSLCVSQISLIWVSSAAEACLSSVLSSSSSPRWFWRSPCFHPPLGCTPSSDCPACWEDTSLITGFQTGDRFFLSLSSFPPLFYTALTTRSEPPFSAPPLAFPRCYNAEKQTDISYRVNKSMRVCVSDRDRLFRRI